LKNEEKSKNEMELEQTLEWEDQNRKSCSFRVRSEKKALFQYFVAETDLFLGSEVLFAGAKKVVRVFLCVLKFCSPAQREMKCVLGFFSVFFLLVSFGACVCEMKWEEELIFILFLIISNYY
jgi:hypothetical protein